MYFTDRGIEELAERRGDEQVTLDWLASRLQTFVDLNPEFETAVERLAKAGLADMTTQGGQAEAGSGRGGKRPALRPAYGGGYR